MTTNRSAEYMYELPLPDQRDHLLVLWTHSGYRVACHNDWSTAIGHKIEQAASHHTGSCNLKITRLWLQNSVCKYSIHIENTLVYQRKAGMCLQISHYISGLPDGHIMSDISSAKIENKPWNSTSFLSWSRKGVMKVLTGKRPQIKRMLRISQQDNVLSYQASVLLENAICGSSSRPIHPKHLRITLWDQVYKLCCLKQSAWWKPVPGGNRKVLYCYACSPEVSSF